MAELDAKRTKRHTTAALAILKHIRTRIDRKKYIAKKRGCVLLQSYWRGNPQQNNNNKINRVPEILNGSYFILPSRHSCSGIV